MSVRKSLHFVRNLSCYEGILALFQQGARVSEVLEFIKSKIPEEIEGRNLLYDLEVYSKYAEEITQYYPPHQLKNAISNLAEFDPFAAHKVLAALQFERVLMDANDEKRQGKTKTEGSKNITLMNTILVDISRLEIEKNTKKTTRLRAIGLETKDANGVVVMDSKVKEQYIDKWGEVTAKMAANPEGRRRILNLIEKVRAQQTPQIAQALQEDTNRKKEEENNK